MAQQSALLLRVPSAEAAVGAHRARFDPAASFGVPAHVTVGFPFKPSSLLSQVDHERLASAFGGMRGFVLRGERTGSFAGGYLHVPVEPADVVLGLVEMVGGLFPEWPIYGGTIDVVVPHVTVGPVPADELAEVAAAVSAGLPFVEEVTEVELWAGPRLDGPVGRGWRRVRGYRLG